MSTEIMPTQQAQAYASRAQSCALRPIPISTIHNSVQDPYFPAPVFLVQTAKGLIEIAGSLRAAEELDAHHGRQWRQDNWRRLTPDYWVRVEDFLFVETAVACQ